MRNELQSFRQLETQAQKREAREHLTKKYKSIENKRLEKVKSRLWVEVTGWNSWQRNKKHSGNNLMKVRWGFSKNEAEQGVQFSAWATWAVLVTSKEEKKGTERWALPPLRIFHCHSKKSWNVFKFILSTLLFVVFSLVWSFFFFCSFFHCLLIFSTRFEFKMLQGLELKWSCFRSVFIGVWSCCLNFHLWTFLDKSNCNCHKSFLPFCGRNGDFTVSLLHWLPLSHCIFRLCFHWIGKFLPGFGSVLLYLLCLSQLCCLQVLLIFLLLLLLPHSCLNLLPLQQQ